MNTPSGDQLEAALFGASHIRIGMASSASAVAIK
jgi:hypothetical protein